MQCNYCERYCRLEEGRHGFCRMYANSGGRLVERFTKPAAYGGAEGLLWRIVF